MRNLDAVSITEKNSSENKPIFLYTIYDYDGSTDMFLAEYDTDITFDGQTYTRFPISHEYVGENTQGEIQTLKVKVANVSRYIQAFLEEYDFCGLKVKITLVWANQLAETDAKIEDIYYIDSYTADEQAVEFNLTSRFDVLDVTLPVRSYSRNYCQWKFKSTECGYAGGETVCNRTLTRCRVLDNSERFGGFPSVPSRRLVIS